MHKFFKDKRVTEYLQNKSIFEICSLKEDNSSRLLAWLLNPNEYHGLGNKFALHILKKCQKKEGKIKVYDNKGEIFKNFRITNSLFKNAFVTTEHYVEIKNENDEYDVGRIDVLAIDEEHNLCLVIENKYGYVEHNGQCEKYMEALKTEENPNIKFVFVFLDLYSNSSVCDAYNNIDYEDILEFKNEFDADDNELASRIFESWELDINGKEDDEKTIKELADEYGDYLETVDLNCNIDDYLQKGNKEGLYASRYDGIISEILNFKNHQSKVYEVKQSEEFTKLIEDNELDFSTNDYFSRGILNFSYNWACNENDNDKWAVYGCIYKEKGNYEFTIQYYAPKGDAFFEKLKSVLRESGKFSKTYAKTDNIKELLSSKNVKAFLKDMEEARKMIEK